MRTAGSMQRPKRNSQPTDTIFHQVDHNQSVTKDHSRTVVRVSVQGVKSPCGHFACLCRGFEFYEVKKNSVGYFSCILINLMKYCIRRLAVAL